ncbi:MAG: hypothetical protein ACQES0_11520, partial [Bacteroidota bacterium]
MKSLRFACLLAALSFCAMQSFSQNCISESSVSHAWTYIPYFNGSSSYLYMDKGGNDSYDDYF